MRLKPYGPGHEGKEWTFTFYGWKCRCGYDSMEDLARRFHHGVPSRDVAFYHYDQPFTGEDMQRLIDRINWHRAMKAK